LRKLPKKSPTMKVWADVFRRKKIWKHLPPII
jgi:hypothetical protein